MQYLKLIRVHQWVKNAFVFLPIFFAGEILNFPLFLKAVLGFLSFSFIASSVYVINDYVDIEKDREHPEKKKRPLASGKVSKKQAVLTCIILFLLAYSFCYFLDSAGVTIVITLYFIMNLAYSFKLKHVAIIDVMVIAIGFLFRVFVGGFSTGLFVSIWAILLTFFLALIMGLGKRRGELKNAELTGKTRKALDGYNLQFTEVAIIVVAACSIVCYIMYTLDPQVQEKWNAHLVYTLLFVVVGILRYLQLTFVYDKTESPTKIVYKDLFMQIDILLWILTMFIMKYMHLLV